MSLALDLLGPDTGFYGTEKGANILRDMIETYWRQRGYKVEVGICRVGFSASTRAPRWEIRSDLVSGLPRDFAK